MAESAIPFSCPREAISATFAEKKNMNNWLDNARLDAILEMFDKTKSGKVPTELLLHHEEAPEDWRRAVGLLVEEGCLKDSGDYYEITYRGKALLHDGGFVRKHRRERALFYCTVVAAASGLAGLLVSLIALVCQVNG